MVEMHADDRNEISRAQAGDILADAYKVENPDCTPENIEAERARFDIAAKREARAKGRGVRNGLPQDIQKYLTKIPLHTFDNC